MHYAHFVTAALSPSPFSLPFCCHLQSYEHYFVMHYRIFANSLALFRRPLQSKITLMVIMLCTLTNLPLNPRWEKSLCQYCISCFDSFIQLDICYSSIYHKIPLAQRGRENNTASDRQVTVGVFVSLFLL